MSAFVTVHLTPKNPEKMQAYSAAAGPTLTAFGGKFVARGPVEVLSGEHGHKVMVVIEFPDKDAARRWYASAEYQATIAVRTEAMDSVFVLAGE
jgi:uncharacterized protein (DUF1330 family)